MPTIQIGVTANSSSAGQTVDFDGSIVSTCSLSNSSGESLQYNVGAGWVTLASGSTANLARFNAASFFVRKTTSDSYPRPLSLTFEAQGSAELTPTQLSAVLDLILGTGKQVLPQFLAVYGGVIFDAGSGQVMPTMRVVVNAATDVIAAQQMMSNGAQAYTTTITGASTDGEVLVLNTGTVNITSVHVGFSTGTSMTLSADSTITVNEMVRWDIDSADLCNGVRVYFSPGRSSGRYIDVSCVGQQRSS
jgi:hypothetical protein